MTKLLIVRENNSNLLYKIQGKKITEYERTKDESKQLSSIDVL